MKKILLFFILCSLVYTIDADENIESLLKRCPVILTSESVTPKSDLEKQMKLRHTDLLKNFSVNQIAVKGEDLLMNGSKVEFLSAEKSTGNFENYHERIKTLNSAIYRIDFSVDTDGEYVLVARLPIGTFGLLNQELVITLQNGVLTKHSSGQQTIFLKKGKQTLYLLAEARTRFSGSIRCVPLSRMATAKSEISKKLLSAEQNDRTWVMTEFLPFIASLQPAESSFLIRAIKQQHQLKPFQANEETITQLKALIPKTLEGLYLFEDYIFTELPDLYFFLSKRGDGKSAVYDGFLLNNNEPRQIFYQQLIFNYQREKEKVYFDKALKTISSLGDFAQKGAFLEELYKTSFVSLFRIGRIRESFEVQKLIQEKKIEQPLSRYATDKPDQEDVITLTQSFDETAAFQLQEMLEGYDGSADRLQAIYKTFTTLTNVLVKRDDGAISLNYIFEVYKNANAKLKEDFSKFCAEKVQPLVDNAKEANHLETMESIIKQYEVVVPLPELHFVLMNEYYIKGEFLKSLSHAYILFDKYPVYHNKIIAKMLLLEEFSDISYEERRVIPKELHSIAFKIRGEGTTVAKFISSKGKNGVENVGELLAVIPLEKPHIQYWNHAHQTFVQPIEPKFLRNNILFNGGSYMCNFSISQKKVTWQYRSLIEYQKENETGPHQKRFFTEHFGDQLFMLTNRDFSEEKTVKSFSLKGEPLWDAAEVNNTFLEEPVCTPIASHGKLFGFSSSKRESIRTINFVTYDVDTGEQKTRTPISYLPAAPRDEVARKVQGTSWNTLTHDQHFCTDTDFVYGYSGSGVIVKVDATSGNILWEKGFAKTSLVPEGRGYWERYGMAPSGFIKIFGDLLISYMPDIQNFIALNKVSGELVWRSPYYVPRFIHAREQSQFLYFTEERINKESLLFKIDTLTGKIIWRVSSAGLPIVGEGDIFGDQLWLPAEKCLLTFNINTGELLKKIPLAAQPLKIRGAEDVAIILTATAAYIFKNSGVFDSKILVEQDPIIKSSPVIEPDLPPQSLYSFENINLEVTLKIPEKYYTSSNLEKTTQLLPTSKPFHFILKCNEYLTLFREGYSLKDGSYIPPEIIWSVQYPWHVIKDDVLYVSEFGKVTARDIFTLKKVWEYSYDHYIPPIRNSIYKAMPVIAVTDQYICFQTVFGSLRLLDAKTRELIMDIPSDRIKILCIYKNYLVASMGSGTLRCYDIDQKGKEIWNMYYSHYGDFFIEKEMLVFVKTNDGMLSFHDFKTGKKALEVKATSVYRNRSRFMRRVKLDDNILYAYNSLYDAKTGKPLAKYEAGTAVVGGGYFGFHKCYGSTGSYIDESGKEYPFTTQGRFNSDNYLYAVGRKGNRVVLFSFFFVETFEMKDSRLVSVDYSTINTGKFGNHGNQFNMDLFVLNDTLLEIREDNMYFFRNFDEELKYEAVQSFRVDNKSRAYWPYSETYPEVEVTEKNWISYFGKKPVRDLAYQLFSDDNYAYLRFKLSPRKDTNSTTTLYISSDGREEKISFIWDVDNWRNAQTSYFVRDNTQTWKEYDVYGNINLFFKIKLAGTYSTKQIDSLPVFNIEFRQTVGDQHIGMYRMGGAYQGIINQVPWLNYINDEAQSLNDLRLRTAQYENKVNFYPQGYDLVIWLKDRRKLKGIDDNLKILHEMLSANVKYYCSVNVLSALFFEELQKLKEVDSGLDELSDDFPSKIQTILVRLHKEALDLGMSKEWVEFALSLWAIEVFPRKISYTANRDYYTKPYYDIYLRMNNKSVYSQSFKNQTELFSFSYNHPFIEWIIPGLIPDFPSGQTIESITLTSFGVNKTALGRMVRYTPTENKEFLTREGKFLDDKYIIRVDKKSDTVGLRKTYYHYKGKEYSCNFLDLKMIFGAFAISLYPIKMPGLIKEIGQTPETILKALEHLPSDSNNGAMMIDTYIALGGKSDKAMLIQAYVKWLESLKGNIKASLKALSHIEDRNREQKDIYQFIGQVAKQAKVSTLTTRLFFVNVMNLFSDKQKRLVLGPFLKGLSTLPENRLDVSSEYKTADTVHKFGDRFEEKRGGSIYLVSKVTISSKDKVFLFIQAVNNYSTAHTSSKFSVWLDSENIVRNATFLEFNNDLYHQKISLKQNSDNILLIRIDSLDDYDWNPRNYRICLGDNYGAPVDGLVITPLP